MNGLKKIFKLGLHVSLLIFVVLSLAFLAVWTWPGILIHEKNVARLADYLRPGIDLTWESLSVDAGSQSFLRKEVKIDARALCLKMPDSGISACFADASIPLVVDIAHWVPHYELGVTKLLGGIVSIAPKTPETEKEGAKGGLELPGFLKHVNLKTLDVGVDSFSLKTGGGELKASAQLHALEKEENILFRLRGKGERGKGRLEVSVVGDIGDGRLVGVVTASAKHFTGSIPEVGVTNCRVTLTEKSLRTNCPASVKAMVPARRPYREDLSAIVDLKVDIKRGDPLFDGKDSVGGDLALDLHPIVRRVKEGRLRLNTRFDGELGNLPDNLSINSSLRFEIEDFRKISYSLRKTPWGIPEPLNSMKGPILFEASAKGRLSPNSETPVPLKLETRLSSPHQKLNLDGNGELLVKRIEREFRTHLKFRLVLADVRLVLPRMEHKAPPRLAPDRRIALRPEPERKVSAEPSFTYEIEILSPRENPVRLVSNLAGADVPVNVSLKLKSGEATDGIVRLGQFPVELFRRTATVDRFELRLADKPENQEVNGRITVAYTDYTIRILILGLASEPTVKFVSEPPLPEDQVMAVLLFGKRTDLNDDEAASVGGARAAVADSAMSLASMYLLASTPVESIGYDQATGVFTAKIRLGDGTSLNIGSDTRQLNQLGVRKRLGPDWTVTTYLSNPLDPIERSLTAFLEWSKGY